MDDLEKQLRDKVREVDAAQKALDALRDEEQALREAIGNRTIDVFWKQNEGLRLNVGDALLVTEEAVAVYGGHSRDIGNIVVIRGFEIKDGNILIDLNLGARRIELDIARRMREAYLREHGEAAGV